MSEDAALTHKHKEVVQMHLTLALSRSESNTVTVKVKRLSSITIISTMHYLYNGFSAQMFS